MPEQSQAQENRYGVVSITALRQYFRYAQERGLDLSELCRTAGLPPDLPSATSGDISGLAFQHFVKTLHDVTDDPLLGLHVGDYVEPGSYNVLGYITMSCATLGEAIDRIAPYEKLVGDMGVTRFLRNGRQLELQWQCAYPDPRVRHHVIDNVFASWINYARWLGNREDASPSAVHLEHEPPAPEYRAAYVDRWRCPVTFGQSANRVCFEPGLLDAPLRQPDPLLRQTLEDHARSRIAEDRTDQRFVTRVRNAIYQQLRQGVTRQDLVAEQLALTPRTLQRKLAQADLSYQALLDELRESLAREYLRDTAVPVIDIALRLGFAEARSFHRSFKGWTGITPGEYRARHEHQGQNSED